METMGLNRSRDHSPKYKVGFLQRAFVQPFDMYFVGRMFFGETDCNGLELFAFSSQYFQYRKVNGQETLVHQL
ncbi:MAG: hypothetical protein DRG63_06215 [Deltaproteobacteria bacterium]|nr:MAG: hypothetical protein DRG63_06215 [Deltaproteobacteria bacterium]RLB24811.1 MAG: hypothetical protein DRG76_00325 [Deltaproteobacteria bacterium]